MKRNLLSNTKRLNLAGAEMWEEMNIAHENNLTGNNTGENVNTEQSSGPEETVPASSQRIPDKTNNVNHGFNGYNPYFYGAAANRSTQGFNSTGCSHSPFKTMNALPHLDHDSTYWMQRYLPFDGYMARYPPPYYPRTAYYPQVPPMMNASDGMSMLYPTNSIQQNYASPYGVECNGNGPYKSNYIEQINLGNSPATTLNIKNNNNAKRSKKQRRVCVVDGCTKFAQGVTRCCTKHGGGKRCLYSNCSKGAVGSTNFCVAHGGGKRCKKVNCKKSAIPMYSFCFAHGGGRRCNYEGCSKGARATTAFCIGHGGGKRCKVRNCSKSDQGAGYCIAHGGGRRRRKDVS